MIDTRGEIIDGNQWPTVHISQVITPQCPSLAEMSELHLRFVVRMVDVNYFEPPPGANGVTLFRVSFLLGNVNPASPGYGEMIWVAAGVFRSCVGIDTTGSCGWLYQFGSWNFTDPAINPDPNADLLAGKWVTFKADMMPLIHQALQAAWENWGYMQNSHDLNDLKFTIFEPGWESGERIKCEMQLRNLSFKAVVP
jgi:hypothetical protein